jgi:hypothetical protein
MPPIDELARYRYPIKGSNPFDRVNMGCILREDFESCLFAVHNLDRYAIEEGRRDENPTFYTSPGQLLEAWKVD